MCVGAWETHSGQLSSVYHNHHRPTLERKRDLWLTLYLFVQIIAINGVTGEYNIESHQPSAQIVTQTNKRVEVTSSPLVEKKQHSSSSVVFEWQPPYPLERDSVIEYTTFLTDVESETTMQNATTSQQIVLEHLQPSTRYSFQVKQTSYSKGQCRTMG